MLSWARPLLDPLISFAQFPSTESLLTRYIPLALLTVLLAALLWKAVRVWGEIHDVEEPDSPKDLLSSFEQAHAAGELDDAEFARVRAQLGDGARSAPRAADAAAARPKVFLDGSHPQSPNPPQQ
jgi:hypothetical protein